MKQNSQKGIAVILVLVFAGVFGLSVSALMAFIFSQAQLGAAKQTREKAFGIAEAGLQYYHWFLAHNPNDYEDGTGGAGPYVHTYSDPETGDIGNFSLEITPNLACGQVQSIDIVSTGTVDADSDFTRTVTGRHAKPSVAEYSTITGADIIIGSTTNIVGPLHANTGVRMDGAHNAEVTSSVATWSSSRNCDGGSPSPGVCGSGGTPVLWEYPISTISFTDMSANFGDLKTYAQTNGIYLAPYGNTNGSDGYRLVFNANDTVDIYQVTNTNSAYGYNFGAWENIYDSISADTFIEQRTIPTDCSLIFVEDKVWLEGSIQNKVTVVSADVGGSSEAKVVLEDNITYSTTDGTSGLSVVSAGDVYISPDAPTNLQIQGIFVAQNGRFGIPYYSGNTNSSLSIHGTIVSDEIAVTRWSCPSFCSGFETNTATYDRLQVTNPPPFTPSSTTTPKYIFWQEQ